MIKSIACLFGLFICIHGNKKIFIKNIKLCYCYWLIDNFTTYMEPTELWSISTPAMASSHHIGLCCFWQLCKGGKVLQSRVQETWSQVLALSEGEEAACVGLQSCVQEGSCSGEWFTREKAYRLCSGGGERTLQRHVSETNKMSLIYFRFELLEFSTSEQLYLSAKLSKREDYLFEFDERYTWSVCLPLPTSRIKSCSWFLSLLQK